MKKDKNKQDDLGRTFLSKNAKTKKHQKGSPKVHFGKLSIYPEDQLGNLEKLMVNTSAISDANKREGSYIHDSLQISMHDAYSSIGDDVKKLRTLFSGFESQISSIITSINQNIDGEIDLSDENFKAIRQLKEDFEQYKTATDVSNVLVYFSRLKNSLIAVMNIAPMIEVQPGLYEGLSDDIELIKFNKNDETPGNARGDNSIEPDLTMVKPISYFIVTPKVKETFLNLGVSAELVDELDNYRADGSTINPAQFEPEAADAGLAGDGTNSEFCPIKYQNNLRLFIRELKKFTKLLKNTKLPEFGGSGAIDFAFRMLLDMIMNAYFMVLIEQTLNIEEEIFHGMKMSTERLYGIHPKDITTYLLTNFSNVGLNRLTGELKNKLDGTNRISYFEPAYKFLKREFKTLYFRTVSKNSAFYVGNQKVYDWFYYTRLIPELVTPLTTSVKISTQRTLTADETAETWTTHLKGRQVYLSTAYYDKDRDSKRSMYFIHWNWFELLNEYIPEVDSAGNRTAWNNLLAEIPYGRTNYQTLFKIAEPIGPKDMIGLAYNRQLNLGTKVPDVSLNYDGSVSWGTGTFAFLDNQEVGDKFRALYNDHIGDYWIRALMVLPYIHNVKLPSLPVTMIVNENEDVTASRSRLDGYYNLFFEFVVSRKDINCTTVSKLQGLMSTNPQLLNRNAITDRFRYSVYKAGTYYYLVDSEYFQEGIEFISLGVDSTANALVYKKVNNLSLRESTIKESLSKPETFQGKPLYFRKTLVEVPTHKNIYGIQLTLTELNEFKSKPWNYIQNFYDIDAYFPTNPYVVNALTKINDDDTATRKYDGDYLTIDKDMFVEVALGKNYTDLVIDPEVPETTGDVEVVGLLGAHMLDADAENEEEFRSVLEALIGYQSTTNRRNGTYVPKKAVFDYTRMTGEYTTEIGNTSLINLQKSKDFFEVLGSKYPHTYVAEVDINFEPAFEINHFPLITGLIPVKMGDLRRKLNMYEIDKEVL